MKLEIGENGWYPVAGQPHTGVVAAHFTHDGIDYTVMALGGPFPTFTTVLTDVVTRDAFDQMGFGNINDDRRAEASDMVMELRFRA